VRLVVDANVLISTLIADSKTRELIVTLGPDLLTPEVVHDEIERYEGLIVEKSGTTPARVEQFFDLLFQYIGTVPVRSFRESIPDAEAELAQVDPDDMLYLACALIRDAPIWSDDPHVTEQSLVRVFTTGGIVDRFDTQ
jgi:predicted nucleic acid-binding protein